MILSSLALALVSTIAISSVPRDVVSRPRIVVLGDSLASGRGVGAAQAFPTVLQEKLDDAGLAYEIVNASVSGDTSTRALRRFDRALSGDVRILIVELGVNDGLRGVPVAQVASNLSRIIETAQARGVSVLLCGMEALPMFGWDYTVAFHNAFGDLAKRYRVPLVPFIMMNVIGNRELMQPDRAHPNAAGARAIAENIWPYLKPLLADTTAHQGR
jgi:acyl-CoA thioesterase-1